MLAEPPRPVWKLQSSICQPRSPPGAASCTSAKYGLASTSTRCTPTTRTMFGCCRHRARHASLRLSPTNTLLMGSNFTATLSPAYSPSCTTARLPRPSTLSCCRRKLLRLRSCADSARLSW
eukprot:GHRQ01021631.1.p3 GENE.GHRQ01021631.1~~GHRQ01021631.1.p3  ORF type:complete len:121 (-),score=23.45 GHRQ01021631.1:1330-1692(-)